jgi:beta-glucosidase
MVVQRMSLAQELAFLNLPETYTLMENYHYGIADLCIPPFILQDGPVGVTLTNSTVLPDTMALSAAFDPGLAWSYGREIGLSATADGVSVVQAPNINTVQMPTWGRAGETFGEDPYVAGFDGAQVAAGIESTGTAVLVKHAGAYIAELNRAERQMQITQRGFEESYIAPLRSLIALHPFGLMCAYGILNGVNQCTSKQLYESVDDLGFAGIVRSDAFAVRQDPGAALAAGLTLARPGSVALEQAAMVNGELSRSQVDSDVHRLLTAMFAAGMIAHPRRFNLVPSTVTSASTALALHVAEEGTVLLDNKGELPYSSVGTLGVFGVAASDQVAYAVQGSSQVRVGSTPEVSPLSGLMHHYGASAVSYDPAMATNTPINLVGAASTSMSLPTSVTTNVSVPHTSTYDVALSDPHATDSATVSLDGHVILSTNEVGGSGVSQDDQAFMLSRGTHQFVVSWPAGANVPTVQATDVTNVLQAAAKKAARVNHAVVVVSTTEGEEIDRASLELPGYQDQLIEAVASANPHTTVVIMSGGAVLMPWLHSVAAVVEQWYPGMEAGKALANVLSGQVDPSGKLPITFPATNSQVPYSDLSSPSTLNLNGPDGVGLDTGLHWYEATKSPVLFPFGYGLSYTSFSLKKLHVAPMSHGYVATVTAKNTGRVAGRVVLEGYVTFPMALGEPSRQLRCFGSAVLTPGQSRVIELTIERSSLSTYFSGHWDVARGFYTLEVGQSATDLPLSTTFSVS